MTRRGVIASSVLMAWGAGLAVLFVRELNPSPAARLAEAALRVVPQAMYYAVEDEGRHVGFASIAFDTVPHALQVTEYVVTEPEGIRRAEQLSVRLSRGLAMREYEATTIHGTDTSQVRGTIVDSILVHSSGGRADSLAVESPVFAGLIGPTVTVLLDDPRVGASHVMPTIDPATGKVGPQTLRIQAESLFVVVDSAVADSSGRWFAVHKDTVRAWRVVAADAPPFDAWIDEQGLVVEASRANGLRLRRTAFEIAFENWRQARPGRVVLARGNGSVMSGTWLASGANEPFMALDSLFVRFGPSTPPELSRRLGRSHRAGATLAVGRIGTERLRARYALPTTEAWQKVFTKELSPGPSIDHDHPAIALRARRLAASDTNPVAIARRIVAWVHDSISAAAGHVAPSASAVIAQRSGDAREFAIVTAAIARAAGVPAQPVTGLLHHDGRFYLHTWAEVYIGRWIPVDAMLGQFPADAAHIPFLAGAAEPGADLARVLTRLELTVVRSVPRQY